MYFEIIEEENNSKIINIKLNRIDIEYLLKNKSISEFDIDDKVRIELK